MKTRPQGGSQPRSGELHQRDRYGAPPLSGMVGLGLCLRPTLRRRISGFSYPPVWHCLLSTCADFAHAGGMPNYPCTHVPSGTCFITAVLADRGASLLKERIEAVRHAFAWVRPRHSFKLDAMGMLADHLHLLWTMPDGDAGESFWHRIPRGEHCSISLVHPSKPGQAQAGRSRGRGRTRRFIGLSRMGFCRRIGPGDPDYWCDGAARRFAAATHPTFLPCKKTRKNSYWDLA